ncbi:MAG: sulfatase-like hydrolase/transferase, partial [Bryobacteraceae bacterium]
MEDNYIEHYSPSRDRSARSSYHQFLVSLGYKPDEPEGTFSREFAARRPAHQTKAAFLATEASEFILRHRRDPWILYVNFLEPHPPYFGPFGDLHPPEQAPLPANYPGLGVDREPRHYAAMRRRQCEAIERKIDWQPGRPSAAESEARWEAALRRLNRNYAGLCNLVDQAVARILWALETSSQADNTIVVFTSDHGEMGGAHSLIQKSVVYEKALHVPML